MTRLEGVHIALRFKAAYSKHWNEAVRSIDLHKLNKAGSIQFDGWNEEELQAFDRWLLEGGSIPHKAKAYLDQFK